MRRHTRHLADARSSRTTPQGQSKLGSGAGSAWSRVSAMLCVLLITLGACVQACHVHDDGPPAFAKASQSSHQNTPGDAPTNTADHCLLCIAMHAAMPSATGVAPSPVRQMQRTTFVALPSRRTHRVSFDLFSRPPPLTFA